VERAALNDAERVYIVIACTFGLAMSVISTLSGIYLIRDVGLGPFQLLLVGSVLEGTVLALEVPTGVVADAVSRKLSILIGFVLMGAGFLLYAVPAFAVVLAGQVVWGAGSTFVSGANVAWVVDEIGEDAARPLFLRASQLAQTWSFVGILVSIGLGAISLALPVAIGGVLFLALAAWLRRAMVETTRPTGDRRVRAALTSTRHAVRLRPVLALILVVAALHGASTEGFDRLWELNLLRNVHLPEVGAFGITPWFGLLRAVGLLIAILATTFVRRHLRDRTSDAAVVALLVTTVLFALTMVAFAVSTSLAAAVVAYWAVTAVRGVNTPLYTAWVNTGLESASRATVNSLSSQADALGQVGGGPVIGWVAAVRSVRAALGFAAALAVPAIPLVRRGRHAERPT
jgi:DHA3 family tetracycline resistance protein-like MFS transporter